MASTTHYLNMAQSIFEIIASHDHPIIGPDHPSIGTIIMAEVVNFST